MDIKGCGKRSVVLTFYVVPDELKSRHRVEGLACGQRAETIRGRGVLLCAECADAYGFNLSKNLWLRGEPPGNH
jgi:hypothetical protein